MTKEIQVNGNTVWTDDSLEHRWYDAVGPNVCKLLEEFVNLPMSAADQPGAYLATLIEGGAGETVGALVAGSVGGTFLITCDIADNDGYNCQLDGEAYYLATRYPTYFGARWKGSEVIQCEFAFGLIISTTDFLLNGGTDGLYFRSPDGYNTLYLVAEKNSIETVIGCGALVDDTYITTEFLRGTDGVVHAYVNGIEVAQLADSDPNFPDDEYLTPTFAILAGEVTNVKTMTVDWIRCIQVQAV